MAFKTRTSEFAVGKAEGSNGPEVMLFIIEDPFEPDNAASGKCSRS